MNTEREITLGERRSWARSHDRDRLSLLLLDPDPIVIRNLLVNPKILERDVLRIASAQPSTAEVLREVYTTPRWSCRRQVQMALVQNPYTPLDIGRPLLELMDEPALREVCSAQSIAVELRAFAQARLRRQFDGETASIALSDDEWIEGLLSRRESKGRTDD